MPSKVNDVGTAKIVMSGRGRICNIFVTALRKTNLSHVYVFFRGNG